MMIKNKRSQHETLGFVLIVAIVIIILVIFLALSAGKGKVLRQNSVEISNLLQASIYYTSDCAINFFPQYQEIQDLISACYKNPEQKCLSGNPCVESTVTTDRLGSKFSIGPKQGPWGHVGGGGDAKAPVLVLSNLKENENIFVGNIEGKLNYHLGTGIESDCRTGPSGTRGYPAMAGFYNDNNELINEYKLADFENGATVPSGATKLYAYVKESPQDKMLYYDNIGGCSFNLVTKETQKIECKNKNIKEKTVCEALNETLREIIEKSLSVSPESPNKAYRLNIYYSPLNNIQDKETILIHEQGVFSNCKSKPGGIYSLPAGTFSSSTINIELELCVG